VRAIEARRFGPPEVLQVADLPDPAPGPGQVLVAAAACDVRGPRPGEWVLLTSG